jgi:predicted dehydrogenase
MAGIDVERRSFGDTDPLALQISDFVRCVRSGAAPIVGARDALTALEIADRICAEMEKP